MACVLAVLLAGIGVIVLRPAASLGPVTVEAPFVPLRPTITALPALDATDLPWATVPVTEPVRIAAPVMVGTATITFRFDPASLPPRTDAVSDVVVLTREYESDLWLPVGTDVDVSAGTASTRARHFSDWVVGVTDPGELRESQALSKRLEESAVVSLLYGERAALSCDANRPLLPAALRDPFAMPSMLCQEQMADGRQKLSYVNTAGMPRLLQLPPGFVATPPPFVRETNQVFADALARRHQGAAVVLPDQGLDIMFAGDAVNQDTTITGTTDWTVYLLSMVRLVGATILHDEKIAAGEKMQKIDKILLSGELWDCLDAGTDEVRESRDAGSAVRAAMLDCDKELVDAAVGILKELGVSAVDEGPATWLAKRIRMVLDADKFLELARNEMNGLLTLVAESGGADTGMEIKPVRPLTYDDAARIPPSPMWTDSSDSARCATAPSGLTVPGVPQRSCIGIVVADLDGNGRDDRLVLWRPPYEELLTDSDDGATGALALMDDGSMSPLAPSPSTWPTDISTVQLFDPARVVRLGDDARQQVVVAVADGANTSHFVALGVDDRRQLRPLVTRSDAPVRLYDSNAALSGTAFGCLTSEGRRVVAVVDRVALSPSDRTTRGVGWERTYLRLTGTTLEPVGREGGVAADDPRLPEGTDCTGAPGPEIGPTQLPAATAGGSARGFLETVVAADRSGASRYLSGVGANTQWMGGRGLDAWARARVATADDPGSWTGVEAECGEQGTDGTGRWAQVCWFQPTDSASALYLLMQRGDLGWTVGGAVSADAQP